MKEALSNYILQLEKEEGKREEEKRRKEEEKRRKEEE
jgi:hypothetical protein